MVLSPVAPSFGGGWVVASAIVLALAQFYTVYPTYVEALVWRVRIRDFFLQNMYLSSVRHRQPSIGYSFEEIIPPVFSQMNIITTPLKFDGLGFPTVQKYK